MALPESTRLGPYELLGKLGAGGMGEVYRARDTRLDRTVAIKVLTHGAAADQPFRERFEREAKAIAAFNHPHICTLHDVGEDAGTSFLVMEYLEGETLAARIARGSLSPPKRCRSPVRSPRHSTAPIAPASCIAISSRRTSSWSRARCERARRRAR